MWEKINTSQLGKEFTTLDQYPLGAYLNVITLYTGYVWWDTNNTYLVAGTNFYLKFFFYSEFHDLFIPTIWLCNLTIFSIFRLHDPTNIW